MDYVCSAYDCDRADRGAIPRSSTNVLMLKESSNLALFVLANFAEVVRFAYE